MKFYFGKYFREGGHQKVKGCNNNLPQSSIPEVLIPGLLRLHVCDADMVFKTLT